MIPKGTTVHRNFTKYAAQVGMIIHPKINSLGKKRFDIFDVTMKHFILRDVSKNIVVGIIIDKLNAKNEK